MLVLSRQENQRIRFPGTGISVEILDIRKSKVSVGIDAPIEVRVLRDELEDFGESPQSDPDRSPPKSFQLPREVRHELRNELHELNLMVHVYKKRADGENAQDEPSQQELFDKVVQRLNRLSRHEALSKEGVPAESTDQTNATGRALVVDDNDNERELMAGFLRMHGHEVLTAADGDEAMRLLQENESLSTILLDINMPGCNGIEFLKQVRDTPRWDPVDVFVVSGSSADEQDLPSESGYTRWFQKPLDPRLLLAELNGGS